MESHAFFHSIRGRLVLLLLLAFLPAAVFVTAYSTHKRSQSIETAKEQALKHAYHVQSVEEHNLHDARQLLHLLSLLPEVRQRDAATCERLFEQVFSTSDNYTGLTLALPSGEVFASFPAVRKNLDFSDRRWFRDTLAGRDFVIGDFIIGRISNKPVAVLGYPVRDESGVVSAVLGLGLDLGWISNFVLENPDSPEGTVISLVDREGRILSSSRAPKEAVGKSFAGAEIVRTALEARQGAAEAAGLDGEQRYYGFTPLGEPLHSPLIVVGISKAAAHAEANSLLAFNLLLLLSMFLVGGAAALIGGKRLILDPVRELGAAAKRIEAGDLSARVDSIALKKTELGGLGRAFDAMAGTLQQREVERREAGEALARREEALRKAEEEYRGIFENAPMAILKSMRGGRYLTINPQGAGMFGYDSPEDMVRSVNDIGSQVYADPGDRLKVMEMLERDGEVKHFECPMKRRDGTVLQVSFNGSARFDESGEIEHVDEFITDITERKRAEEERDRQLKLQAVLEMAGAASHEISQPLQVIMAEASFLLAKAEQDDLESLAALDGATRRLADIVFKIQRITRYETEEYVRGERIIDLSKASSD